LAPSAGWFAILLEMRPFSRSFAGTGYANVEHDMTWRRVRSRAVAAFAVPFWLVLGSCISPTLPVPPPEPLALQEPLATLAPGGSSIEVDGRGAAKLALVAMWNEEVQAGTVVKADDTGAYRGSLVVDVSCTRPHNHIQLWQTDMEGNTSEVKTYRLPNSFGDVALPPDDAGCPDAGSDDANAAADAGNGID
jgi:hypothetical protein